jgi:hypothetical protein
MGRGGECWEVSTNTPLKRAPEERYVRGRQFREFIHAAKCRRRYLGARAPSGAMDRLLGAALAAACDARYRDRNFPCRLLARSMAVAAADRTRHRAMRLPGPHRHLDLAAGSGAVPLSP